MSNFFKRFHNLKISTRLYILGAIMVVFLNLLAITAAFFQKSSKTLTILSSEQRVFLDYYNKGMDYIFQYRFMEDEKFYDLAIQNLETANRIPYTFTILDSLIHTMPRKEWLPLAFDVYKEGCNNDIKLVAMMGEQISIFSKINKKKLRHTQQFALQAYKNGENLKRLMADYKNEKTDENFGKIISEHNKMDGITADFASSVFEMNNYISSTLRAVFVGLTFILIILIFLITHRISISIAQPIRKLTKNFNQLAKGGLADTFRVKANNEIGDLSRASQELKIGIYKIIRYVNKVAKEDFSDTIKPISNEDQITPALNIMASSLKKSRLLAEDEKWLQKGIGILENKMRGNYTVRELSERIIIFLSEYLDFPLGAVYVYDDVEKHLEFTGSIGLEKKEVQNIIQLGEGLIGKAAVQQEIQQLSEFGKRHRIFSATGEIQPSHIYLIPYTYHKTIQAVIEIASLHEFDSRKLNFLIHAGENISITLNAAVARFRHKELLDKTLEQADVLQLREEELNQKLEENKEMQAKLSEQKALLDAMLKTLPDYIYFKDKNSKFLRISHSMVDLFNAQTPEEIVGKDDFDFHPKKDAKRYFEEEQKIIETGKGFIDEVRKGVDENGEELWTSVTKLPMYDDSGKCIGTFGISKDITNIKKLEIEVQKQNESLLDNKKELEDTIQEMNNIQDQLVREKTLVDSMLENIPDAIYFKDKDSKFLKISKSMRDIFEGAGVKDIIGLTDFDIQDEKHARKAFEDELEIMRTGKAKIGYIEKEIKKDGSERYVLSTKMPYFDGNGDVIGTFGISRDITELKKLEIEIQEQNDKLIQQQEELEASNKELTVQEEELRTSNEELKSQEEELRVANEELAEQTKILTESEKSLQLQQEELRVANEELELKTSELESQKKEVTEKNDSLLKIQDELKQKARELEQASQYKSEFLANMSHELRTPLNSMLILSKLLSGNKKGNLNEEQLKSVNIIHKSGKELLELINEILDLSKIEAGKMTYEFGNTVSSDIQSEILYGFKSVVENKGLELEVEMSDDFPETLYTDRQRLMQIIKNLLSNAIKFTSKGGITVQMGRTTAKTKFRSSKLSHKNTCFIAVEDTGVGIPKNKLDAIFEAFQQADGSISRKFGGTGLGLSISRQLVQVMGGEIHVSSEEGRGSVFTVILPTDKNLVGQDIGNEVRQSVKEEVKPEPKKDKKPKESKAKKEEKKKKEIPFFIEDDRNKESDNLMVLIIHSDKNKAQQLLDLSHKKRFNALVASNIEDGAKLAKKYYPKAIILSASLNEPEEFEKLKNNKATSRLPIHVVSKIEDDTFSKLNELRTPESGDPATFSQNLEGKIHKEFNQVLVVEDDPATLEAIHQLFEEKDIIIHDAKNGQEAYEMISAKTFDCVILDLGLPDITGQELLKKLHADNIPLPNVIIHTARELSEKELRELHKFSDSIVIKGVKSDERLMDEVSLFLHEVATSLPKSARMPAPDENDNEGFKGKRILVVDDDIRNIFALAQILEEKEIEILEAENGEMALDVLKEDKNIDLVLMDIMMPVMDGYEAMKEIRSTPGIEDIPIITLTAKAMKEDYQKAIDHGANDYISKPVDTDKLFSLLKIWLFK